jgi:beta-lysine 5,6-aminomutase beta subunit
MARPKKKSRNDEARMDVDFSKRLIVSADQQKRVYGAVSSDGQMEISVSLPILSHVKDPSAWACEWAKSLGFRSPKVLEMYPIDYGELYHFLIRVESDHEMTAVPEGSDESVSQSLSFQEINELIKSRVKKKLTLVGAYLDEMNSYPSFDVLFHLAGYQGEPGFERYPAIDARNWRARFPVDQIMRNLKRSRVDVLLLANPSFGKSDGPLKEFLEAVKKEEKLSDLIVIGFAPELDSEKAKALGLHDGFSPTVKPSAIAEVVARSLPEPAKQEDVA